MSTHTAALQDVASLLDERRQYEGWLAALETRRETTPAHVFERVDADYRGRLARVHVQLSAHHGAINDELNGMRSRMALIDAEIRVREDERSEVELRVAVGELSEREVKMAVASVSDALNTLQVERSGIEASMAQLAGLLDPGAVGEPGNPEAAPPAAASAAAPSAISASAVASSPPAAAVPTATVDAEPTIPGPMAAAEAVAPSAPSDVTSAPASPASGGSMSQAGGGTQPDADGIRIERSPEVGSPSPALHSGMPRSSNAGRRSTPFDELGFLSAVVADATNPSALPATQNGPRLSGVVRDDAPTSILGTGRFSREVDRSEVPLSDNVASNTPIRLRSSGAMEQQKTLKCAGCSSMNFPTEWYCTSCGAELAAL